MTRSDLRYQQGHKPTGTKNELKALRTLEKALLQAGQTATVTNISMTTLDQAAQIMEENYSKGSSYHGGRELERLAKFLTANHLVTKNLSNWRNPIKRKKDEIQTGQKAKDRRESKLPSTEAIDALAEIFASKPTDPRDIFTSAVFAMLMCAPSRISEVLELPVDCEIEQRDSKGVMRYGWRFYSAKGFGGDIKWIPSEMVDVAKEAIRRIKILTSEARKLASWIEKKPGRFYRHANCLQIPEDQKLSALEACQAMGMAAETKHRSQSSLRNMNLPNKDGENTLASLWKHASMQQPEGLPWLSKKKKVKFSNALFCMLKHQLSQKNNTRPIVLWQPTNNVFNNDLSPRDSMKDDYHKSIFDRFGYKTKDGKKLKINSHQARHLLDTIAQRGGLSQEQIAKWSGRADPKQNRTYNHMSEFEIVNIARELDTSLTLYGPSAPCVRIVVALFN